MKKLLFNAFLLLFGMNLVYAQNQRNLDFDTVYKPTWEYAARNAVAIVTGKITKIERSEESIYWCVASVEVQEIEKQTGNQIVVGKNLSIHIFNPENSSEQWVELPEIGTSYKISMTKFNYYGPEVLVTKSLLCYKRMDSKK